MNEMQNVGLHDVVENERSQPIPKIQPTQCLDSSLHRIGAVRERRFGETCDPLESASLSLKQCQVVDNCMPQRSFLEGFSGDFLRGISPLAETVLDCEKALRMSLDSTSPLIQRLEFLPEQTGELSASGSYYVPDTTGQIALVVKPARQEVSRSYKEGIPSGQSAIREWLVWRGQELLKYDFGIPAVSIALMPHDKFLDLESDIVRKSLAQMRAKGVEITEKEFLRRADQFSNLTLLTKWLIDQKQEKPFATLKSRGMQVDERRKLVKVLEKVDLDSSDVCVAARVVFGEKQWIEQGKAPLNVLCELIQKQKDVDLIIETLWNHYLQKRPDPEPTLVSAQSFAPHVIDDLEDIDPRIVKQIPLEEFIKFVIDIIFLNSDRHLGNVLVKDFEKVYKLVLIDHGYCLPDPLIEEDYKGLKQTHYGFLDLPQAEVKIEGELAEVILRLDIDRYIATLCNDLDILKRQFPNYIRECSIPGDCFLLLRCDLLLLKKGVEMGASLKEIAMTQCYIRKSANEFIGGEMIQCMSRAIITDLDGHHRLNEHVFVRELEKVFTSDRCSTEPPWEDLNYQD